MFLASLSNRIFLAAAVLVVLAVGCIAWFVSGRVTDEAEEGLQRGLVEAGAVVGRQSDALSESVALLARLTADLPKLKAAVATGDPPTVQPLAVEYQLMLARSSLVLVTDRVGRVLGNAGPAALDSAAVKALPSVQSALAGKGGVSFWSHPSGILQVSSVPITVGRDPVETAGTFSLGFLMDQARASDFKILTGSEIAFGLNGRIRAATLPTAAWPAIETAGRSTGISRVDSDDTEYVALSKPISPGASAAADSDPAARATHRGAFVVVLRSRTEQLRFLGPIQTGIGVMVVVAVLMATLLSYAVARTVTRPLAAITAVMKEVAATGDLTRRIPPRPGAWEDEDARLLASTFNTLTESIAKFERDASLRERLSSLGRLSSVVAHEVRNPLMIIKSAVRTLRQPGASAESTDEALQDIDAEVARLNRIVSEVLDYAKPLTFAWQTADLNELCREAARAVETAEPGIGIALALSEAARPVVTDGDRLRTVLVNVLSNAAQAVRAARAGAAAASAAAGVECRSEATGEGGVNLIVRDWGVGIDPGLLARVFEPYFTTRRAGTGLGLAIARNIVEGLGGTITVANAAPQGSVVRIEVPARPPTGTDSAAV
ncbi:MAG: ATP-binding protein [Acidobacteriota bacterium]